MAERASTSRQVRPGKEISVMAWVEDPYGHVLLVKQRSGNQLWTFPGGKVYSDEGILEGLIREVKEEIGAQVDVAAPIDIYDRPQRESLTILFRVLLKKGRMKSSSAEIVKVSYRPTLPKNATPSAKYFWERAQKGFEPLGLFF